MTVVVDVVVVAHVEIDAGVLVGVVRALALATAGHSSFPYNGPCFSRRPCTMPSDLNVAPGS